MKWIRHKMQASFKPICAPWFIVSVAYAPLDHCAYKQMCVQLCKIVCFIPGFPVTRMFLATLTLSSELRAQSTIPLHPFIGKVISAFPATGLL